jgi:peptidoglycan/LPS O-acetylase OafA/YrhL
MTIDKANHPHYMPTLDGVRGLACLIVVLHHFRQTLELNIGDPWNEIGSAGVLIFFALSGFLMTRLYYHTPLTYDSGMKYIVSRFSRITPAYYIAILFVWLVYIFHPEFQFQMDPVMLVRSFMFIGSEGVFWSIPPEIQFYLFFVFIWFCHEKLKAGNHRWTVALIAISLFFIATKSFWPGILLPSKYHIFLYGFLAGVLIGHEKIRHYACNIWFQSVIMLATAAYFYLFITYDNIYVDLIFPILVAAMVMSLSVTTPASWVFQTSFLRLLGNASFSIYLFHHPIMQIYAQMFDIDQDSSWLHFAVVITASMALPIMFYFLCERHLNKMAKEKGIDLANKAKLKFMAFRQASS